MQLDKAVTAPGLFAPARTWSLVRDDAGLYMIYTGRAMSLTQPVGVNVGVSGYLAGKVLDKIAEKRALEIAAVEEKLRASGPAALKDTKHSRFFPRESIKAVTVKTGGWTVAVVQADKKVKLHFQLHDPEKVRELFAPWLK